MPWALKLSPNPGEVKGNSHMAETQKPLKSEWLDLSTTGEVEREFITIDGKPYDLRSIDELSINQQQRVAHCGSFIQKYFEKQADGNADRKAARLVEECLQQVIVDLPVEVSSKLSDAQKLKIVTAFNEINTPESKGDEG